jgi:hypothetical protein
MPATVSARPPCTCNARRWFECRCVSDGFTYTGEGHPWEIEDIGIPTPHFVAHVAKLHPGWDLVYADGPAYLADRYAAALQGVA